MSVFCETISNEDLPALRDTRLQETHERNGSQFMEGISTGVHGMGPVEMIVAIHGGCAMTSEPVDA